MFRELSVRCILLESTWQAEWSQDREKKITTKCGDSSRLSSAPTLHLWVDYERSLRKLRRAVRARNSHASAGRTRCRLYCGAARSRFSPGVRSTPPSLLGPAYGLVFRRAANKGMARRQNISETRGSESYRCAQDQQLSRTGVACAADGQEADHCRDRRRPARRGYSNGLRPSGNGVRYLHG